MSSLIDVFFIIRVSIQLAVALDPIAPAFDKLRNLLIFGKRDALLPAYLVP
jgi:hypothetical protein